MGVKHARSRAERSSLGWSTLIKVKLRDWKSYILVGVARISDRVNRFFSRWVFIANKLNLSSGIAGNILTIIMVPNTSNYSGLLLHGAQITHMYMRLKRPTIYICATTVGAKYTCAPELSGHPWVHPLSK